MSCQNTQQNQLISSKQSQLKDYNLANIQQDIYQHQPQDTQTDYFIHKLNQQNQLSNTDSQIITVSNSFSQNILTHPHQFFHLSQSQLHSHEKTTKILVQNKSNCKKCCLLILFIVLLITLVKSTIFIYITISTEVRETNLHSQIDQTNYSLTQISSQIKDIQKPLENNQYSQNQSLQVIQHSKYSFDPTQNSQILQSSNSSKKIISETKDIKPDSRHQDDSNHYINSTQSKQASKNQQNWTLRQNFRQNVPPINSKVDKYEFKQSSDDLVANSALKKFYNDSPWLPNQTQYGVGSAEHELAIRLMQVTHNVNFQGKFVFDHFNHYSSAEEKYRTLERLLTQQKKFYEQKYQISKYVKKQLRFCVFVTSYNNMNNRICLRNLDSIFQQQYKNYHVVYINDASEDATKEYVEKYMQENQIPQNMYTLINNEKNMLNTHNTYKAAHDQCKLGQIMVLVDGDDALIGRQVFTLLNAFYQREKPALVYTQLLFIYPNHIGNSRNQPINTTIFEKTGAWRKQHRFCTSHLKTFYVDLFRMIKKEDLQFDKDQWIPHSPDVAYMTPMLEMAGHRVKFLTEITYQYRHDTGANEPVSGFQKVNPKIFAKKPYNMVVDLGFADNQIITIYP